MRTTVDAPRGALAAAVAEATGQHLRENAVLPRTGGPAGNAVLTAWTGLVLLILSVAELLTLFDVRGLLSWHVAIGALLVPPATLKTVSTGWRLVRYYLGNEPYQEAGPPPTLMRLLGPIVVVSTLCLLATGVVLVLLGQDSSRQVLVSALGFQVNWVTVHQVAFVAWATATGLHLLGRIVPALRIAFAAGVRIPGRTGRLVAIGLVLMTAAALAVVLVHADASWASPDRFGR
jgi:hypothetical protein